MNVSETSRLGVEPDAQPVASKDDEIKALVTRLSRTHPSGGKVIERAAILAEGPDLDAVVGWITAHAGQPEATVSGNSTRGLHAPRLEAAATPMRYVLPAEALD